MCVIEYTLIKSLFDKMIIWDYQLPLCICHYMTNSTSNILLYLPSRWIKWKKFPSKDEVHLNILIILVTLDTSHFERGPH